MDRQTTLAFVIIGLIFIIWLYFNTPEPVKQTPQKQDTSVVQKENKITPPVVNTETAPVQMEVSDSIKYGKFFSHTKEPERIITFENDKFLLEFSTSGGDLRKAYLKNFNNWYSIKDTSSNIYKNKGSAY